jgi:hypothetical protein
LRRVSFDLTGFPPPPGELVGFQSEFETSAAPARGRVVDRLLASPGFGERWTAVWLDLARYSDTYGFEKDPHRNTQCNTQCNTEGGTDDEEFRVAAVIDRVSTTWTAWQAANCG